MNSIGLHPGMTMAEAMRILEEEGWEKISTEPCKDCNGLGKIVLFNLSHMCDKCNGLG